MSLRSIILPPLTLSFSNTAFGNPPTFNFSSANSNGTGIVEADGTVLRDNLKTSYWFYDVDGVGTIFIKVVKVEFRLNGNALEVREQAARYRTGTSVPAANRTNAYFSGAGWTAGSYRLDLVRVSSQAIIPIIEWENALTVQSAGVGIGTTSPTHTLTVSGSAQITGQLYDSDGDAGTSGQVLSNTGTSTNWITNSTDSITDADDDTQIQVEEGSDDDTIRFDTAGTERMLIDNNGNVGIGTSTPTAVLHVSTTSESLAAATNSDVTNIPNNGTWTTLITDVTTVDDITPLTLSFSNTAFSNPPTFNFSSANSNGTGIVEADGTVLRDNLKTSYWFYDVDGGFIKTLRVEFRLNGNALEVREQAARYRSGN